MKRILAIFLLLFTLCGCNVTSSDMDDAMELRNRLLSGGCGFDVKITADYIEKVYKFRMNCSVDSHGTMTFSVTEPDSIAGISGSISDEDAKLTFNDQVLLFETIADGQITPVSAPWLLIRTLRSGYLKACGSYDGGLYIQIDDSYAEDALHLEVWTDENNIPVQAEIQWQGRRVLSMSVENFTFL